MITKRGGKGGRFSPDGFESFRTRDTVFSPFLQGDHRSQETMRIILVVLQNLFSVQSQFDEFRSVPAAVFPFCSLITYNPSAEVKVSVYTLSLP